MKIAIYGIDSFIGSSISNYFIQHSDYDILGFLTTKGPYQDLEPSLRSKSRFSYQVATDADIKSVSARLLIDQPKYIICIGSVPPVLRNRADTILITSDYTNTDGKKTLLVPDVFGPRQRITSGLAKVIVNLDSDEGQPEEKTKSYIYIKDIFADLQSFLISDSLFFAVRGIPASETEVARFLSAYKNQTEYSGNLSQDLRNGLIHTFDWYRLNTWIRNLKDEPI